MRHRSREGWTGQEMCDIIPKTNKKYQVKQIEEIGFRKKPMYSSTRV